AADREEGHERERVRGAAPEEHPATTDAVEQRADQRSERDARGESRAEHDPDRQLVATHGADEEREEEKHPEAHAAAAVDRADAAYARTQGAEIDGALHAGQRIGPFAILGAAGKSPGEVALHCPKRRILIVGDAVIGNPPGKLSLLREKVMDDPARLRASVTALAEVDVDVLLPGDGEPILRDAQARLRELAASFGGLAP